MRTQDPIANALLTPADQADPCFSTSMELPPSVLSLFPNTDPVGPDDHNDDHFSNPFPNSDTPDDSLFSLFPYGATPNTDPDVNAMSSHQLATDDHFIPQMPKKDPAYDPFLPPAGALDPVMHMPPRHESLKRKRPENMRTEPEPEQENKTAVRDYLPQTDPHPYYAAPNKRARSSICMESAVANFAPVLQEPACDPSLSTDRLYAQPFTHGLELQPVPEKPQLTASKAASKPRSPSKRRKKSPKSREKSPGTSNTDSTSEDGSASPSSTRKPRSLTHMKSLARSHAPEVALTQDELHQIAGMHESEEELAHSRAFYREVVAFKAALARFGYRLAALTLDPLTEPSAGAQDESFDFVLKRKMRPVPAVAPPTLAKTEPEVAKGLPVPASNGAVSQSIAADGSPVSAGSEIPPANSGKQLKATSALASDSHGFNCTVCTKTVSDFDTLIRHFRHGHQELKPFCCPRCKGSYSSEGTLWHHIRNVHSETPRKFRCSQCDASYDSFGAKTRHEHATHNTDTPEFVCTFEECNRAFNFPAHLESHAMHDHPGFKPFGCTECTKRFNSANGLIRHKREVHRRNRAYSCSCGTTFAKKDHLKRHLLQRHSMSYEKATEEMRKQPSPGLVQFMPPAAPAAAEAV